MATLLRALIVEDSEDDALLVLRELRRAGFEPKHVRVDTPEDLRAALSERKWDAVISDYKMPRFTAPDALAIVRESGLDLPFIIVSGTVGEEVAVAAMKAGAHDYLPKSNLLRLGPAVTREMREAENRRERRQAQEDLARALEAARENEEVYRTLVEASPDGITMTDLEGKILKANRQAATLHGFDRPEGMLGRNAFELIAPEDRERAAENLKKTLDTGSVVGVEYSLLRKDGAGFAGELTASLLSGSGGEPAAFMTLTRDVTERKKLEEQVRVSQRMETVGRLAGGVAHDFNNVLAIINCYSAFIEEECGDNDTMRDDLRTIQEAAARAERLTGQLLAFSRRQIQKLEVFDANAVVEELTKMLRRLIGEDIDLQQVLAGGLWLVSADRGQIEQVLLNLAVNARDAMPTGGKLTVETANVELGLDTARSHANVPAGPYVRLAVTDNGTGMTAEVRERAFEPFFTTKEGKGTGLGLSTVYGIVKQSGGHISVRTEPGRGTAFEVYLPRTRETDVSPPAARLRRADRAGSETILVVEDEPMVREAARRILSRQGYRVLQAGDGREALLVCEQHQGPIHLMLTDVVMPGMSGKELAGQLEGLRPELRVLYMSGYTEDAIVHHGVLAGEIPFVEKPFAPDTLLEGVQRLLAAPEKER